MVEEAEAWRDDSTSESTFAKLTFDQKYRHLKRYFQKFRTGTNNYISEYEFMKIIDGMVGHRFDRELIKKVLDKVRAKSGKEIRDKGHKEYRQMFHRVNDYLVSYLALCQQRIDKIELIRSKIGLMEEEIRSYQDRLKQIKDEDLYDGPCKLRIYVYSFEMDELFSMMFRLTVKAAYKEEEFQKTIFSFSRQFKYGVRWNFEPKDLESDLVLTLINNDSEVGKLRINPKGLKNGVPYKKTYNICQKAKGKLEIKVHVKMNEKNHLEKLVQEYKTRRERDIEVKMKEEELLQKLMLPLTESDALSGVDSSSIVSSKHSYLNSRSMSGTFDSMEDNDDGEMDTTVIMDTLGGPESDLARSASSLLEVDSSVTRPQLLELLERQRADIEALQREVLNGQEAVKKVILKDIKEEMETIARNYECPITNHAMSKPAVTHTGRSYEESAIEDWFERSDLDPQTGERIKNKNVIPNMTLKALINDMETFITKISMAIEDD